MDSKNRSFNHKLLHLSFHVELLEARSSSYAHCGTEILSQSLELSQGITLHVAQDFLSQQAQVHTLLNGEWKADTSQGLSQMHLRLQL